MGAQRSGRPWRDEEWMRERYVERGMTQVAIAEEAGCSVPTIWKWLDEHGIEKRDPYDHKLGLSRERICGMYEGGMTQAEIAEELGCTAGTVSYHLGEAGVEVRTGPHIPDDELEADVMRVVEKVGGAPSVAEYRELGEYSGRTVAARFGRGSFVEAVEAIRG